MAFTKIVAAGINTGSSFTVQELNTVGVMTAGAVQVGSATTIRTTGIDLGSGNLTLHNINSTGIITATSFVGTINTPAQSNITSLGTLSTLNVTGNVTIGGTLTYDDVTNIDSVGIISARSDIHVGAGLSVVGVSTLSNTVVGGATTELVVTGDARVTGILTVGTASVTLDGTTGKISGLTNAQIGSISSTISSTAVDIFVYDTSKDSDGGAWRNRTQYTSWYNETLNTATRGSRREFPSVAVLVAETDKLTIYDGDNSDLPMWMVFTQPASGSSTASHLANDSAPISSIFMLNGILCVGFPNNGWGISQIEFVSDSHKYRWSGGIYVLPLANNIAKRNVSSPWKAHDTSTTNIGLGSANVNHISMIVLPSARIDSASGLPVPTIAVATAIGASIIRDTDIVVDKKTTDSASHQVHWMGPSRLLLTAPLYYGIFDDIFYEESSNYLSNIADSSYYNGGSDGTNWNYPRPIADLNTNSQLITIGSRTIVAATNSGLNIHELSLSAAVNNNDGIVAYATTTYNTGWMPGYVRGAYLSDTDDTNKTNGQTDPDRSVSNLPLTVTGTITKSAIATGTDLVAYSGFTGSNYMDNTSYSVNFGNPATISIVFWQKITDITDYSYAVSFSDGTSIKGGISNGSDATGYAGEAYFFMGSSTLYTGLAINDGYWHCLVGTISGTSKKFYLDGREVASATITNHDMTGVDKIHVGSYGTTHAYAHKGSLALLRVSNSTISPEQVKKIYEDEKHLFQENAKCTLYGSSSAVTGLAYDEVTDHLHVGTSSGRSDFQGLLRINNTTVGITSAISAHDELIVEQ